MVLLLLASLAAVEECGAVDVDVDGAVVGGWGAVSPGSALDEVIADGTAPSPSMDCPCWRWPCWAMGAPGQVAGKGLGEAGLVGGGMLRALGGGREKKQQGCENLQPAPSLVSS